MGDRFLRKRGRNSRDVGDEHSVSEAQFLRAMFDTHHVDLDIEALDMQIFEPWERRQGRSVRPMVDTMKRLGLRGWSASNKIGGGFRSYRSSNPQMEARAQSHTESNPTVLTTSQSYAPLNNQPNAMAEASPNLEHGRLPLQHNHGPNPRTSTESRGMKTSPRKRSNLGQSPEAPRKRVRIDDVLNKVENKGPHHDGGFTHHFADQRHNESHQKDHQTSENKFPPTLISMSEGRFMRNPVAILPSSLPEKCKKRVTFAIPEDDKENQDYRRPKTSVSDTIPLGVKPTSAERNPGLKPLWYPLNQYGEKPLGGLYGIKREEN